MMIYLKNTITGKEYNCNQDEYHVEIGKFSQSVDMIAMVHNDKSHLISSDFRLIVNTALYLRMNSVHNVYIRLFHKSDIDEALVMASKLHNVDLIPINTNRN